MHAKVTFRVTVGSWRACNTFHVIQELVLAIINVIISGSGQNMLVICEMVPVIIADQPHHLRA